MTQTLGSDIVYEDGNPPLYSGSSDPYDIEMRFDPTSLGATVIDLPQTQLCQFCNFSVDEERTYCDTCNSIGYKDCFKNFPK